MEKITIQYIWQDRKRHFGLPLSFTRYALSEDRLFLSTGLLNVKDDDILLYRVTDITTTRNLFQMLFGVGTVLVTSSDKTCPLLVMKNVKNPLAVKELLHRTVEDMKVKRRVRFGEFSTSCDSHGSGMMDDNDLDGDGIPDDQ